MQYIMNRRLVYFLAAATLLIFGSFGEGKGYKPLIHVEGTILDFRTQKPLTNYPVYAMPRQTPEIEYNPDNWNLVKTDKQGRFVTDFSLDKDNPEFWLVTKDFAHVQFVVMNPARLNEGDTLDVGQVFLVAYDNEMKEERSNVPEEKKKATGSDIEKYSLAEVDKLFQDKSKSGRMIMNPVQTVEGEVTTVNIGYYDSGTITRSYKVLTFKIELQE